MAENNERKKALDVALSHIPERIGKTEITTQERDMLRAGLPVRDKLIERNDGRKFVTNFYFLQFFLAFIHINVFMTEIRSAHRSARSRRSTPNCRIPHRSPGPVRPVTARRSSKLH